MPLLPYARTGTTVQITFVRHPDAPDRIYVVRDDGTEVSWSFPSYGEGLPHDLVHLLLERRFGLRQGFWGRVADGVDVARINAAANREGGKGKYAGFGDDLRELYLAEALAGAPWSLAELDDAALLQMLHAQVSSTGAPAPALSVALVTEIRAELEAVRQRWRAQAPKGALRFEFP
ncbi:hypothetical protein [Paraliomyxa miuraensis]|uniref:hypothetical protein n=1 Tax=Paraliomyxa miuraensis TaxID=376150 RepID=UPI00224F9AD6|nr:hypothetical protein [Paraliomyxa miuraensis]MCX4243477.1 hypothetical protein [Paraliomyxa miuraensis]